MDTLIACGSTAVGPRVHYVLKRFPVRERGTVHSADLGTSSKESY